MTRMFLQKVTKANGGGVSPRRSKHRKIFDRKTPRPPRWRRYVSQASRLPCCDKLNRKCYRGQKNASSRKCVFRLKKQLLSFPSKISNKKGNPMTTSSLPPVQGIRGDKYPKIHRTKDRIPAGTSGKNGTQ